MSGSKAECDRTLCETCRFHRICVLSPETRTYCKAYSHERRELDDSGRRVLRTGWVKVS
jgi:hypothetical protein